MKGYFLACLLIVLIGMNISSCQDRQEIDSGLSTPTPTTSPPTITAHIEAQPIITETSVSPNQPVCFQTYLAPVAFMADNSRILIRADKGVQIYHLERLEEESFLKSPTRLNGPAVALSPDGETLAWALEDYSIQLVRMSDQELLSTLSGHTGPVTKLRFSPTGDRLYSASHDGWVKVWNIDGELAHSFQPGGGEILGIGISANGATLATLPFDGPVKMWDTQGFQEKAELGGTGGFDTSDVAFSPDSRFVAADLATGLSVWEVKTGALVWGGINSMAFGFSPAGNLMAYTDISKNNDIVLISPDGKQPLNTLRGLQGTVFELLFSPDASLLAMADGIEIRIWRVADNKLLYIGKNECP